jgi:prefoldin subunit 5
MRQRGVYEFDNRDSAEVYQYMESRIEALQRRIRELEAENEALLCTTVITTAEGPGDDALRGLTSRIAAGRSR